MDNVGYRLQPEYEQALTYLLRELASPADDPRPYVVLTTAPATWLPQCGGDDVKLLDVSRMTGDSLWRSGADVMDEMLGRIRVAGWPDALIARDYHASHGRADLALLDTNGRPVALLELEQRRGLRNTLLRQMEQVAGSVSARYALLYDGNELVGYDSETGASETLERFPSPSELGVSPLPALAAESNDPVSGVSVIRVARVEDIGEELSEPIHTTAVIDHTMPWGVISSPFISGARQQLPRELRTKRLDSLSSMIAVAAACERVRRLVTIVPASIAVSASALPLRDYLTDRLGLAGVIEMPTGFFMPVAGIASSVLVLGQHRDDNRGEVAFISVPDRSALLNVERQRWFTEFVRGLRGHTMTMGFGAEVSRGSPWSANVHSPDLKITVQQLERLGRVVELGTLCHVIAGYRHTRHEAKTGKGVRVVRGRDLTVGDLTKDSLTSYEIDAPVPPRCELLVGDVLLQRVGYGPKVMIVSPDLQGAVASDTVFVLRPKEESVDTYWIAQFLGSGTGKKLLNAHVRSVGAPTLAISDVRRIPIPVASSDVSRDLVALQELENRLRARADALASSRLDVFAADSPQEMQSRLKSIRKMARVAAESVGQTDSMQFRLRNFYPFPVAYGYRLLIGYTDPQELYREQLRVAENMLAFLASLTLALLEPRQHGALGLDLVTAWQGGLSPGHWLQIAQTGSKTLREDSAGDLGGMLAGLWAGKKNAFLDAVNGLIKAKNDFKHDRGPKGEEECRQGSEKTQQSLDKAIEALDFLTDYPILLIRDLDVVRGSHVVLLRALQYVGDHPGLAQRDLRYHEPLKKGDLYIQIAPEKLAALFPFITCHHCPTCESRETYFLDRRDSRPGRKTILKSFERGHTLAIEGFTG